MTIYYKATRPDGTDFWTGKLDYAAALGDAPITLPTVDNPKCCTDTVLHAATVPTETLSGGWWPCRLFLVEGEPVAQVEHKLGLFSLRVVEEIDPHLALGPNGVQVARVIETARTLTTDQARAIGDKQYAELNGAHATLNGIVDTTWYVAQEYARYVAQGHARIAAWYVTSDVSENINQYDIWNAFKGAVRAAVVRDLISDEHYQVLAGSWESVFGPIFNVKEEV